MRLWLLPVAALVCSALPACGDDDDTEDPGVGGLGGTQVGAGAGGSAMGGRAGAASSGGSGAAGGSPSGPDLGKVGSGSVQCNGAAEDVCPAGTVCCERFPFGEDSCEPSFEDCDGTPIGCDDTTDCGAELCCAVAPSVGIGYYGVGCRATCNGAQDHRVCNSDTDCTAPTLACQETSQEFKACF